MCVTHNIISPLRTPVAEKLQDYQTICQGILICIMHHGVVHAVLRALCVIREPVSSSRQSAEGPSWDHRCTVLRAVSLDPDCSPRCLCTATPTRQCPRPPTSGHCLVLHSTFCASFERNAAVMHHALVRGLLLTRSVARSVSHQPLSRPAVAPYPRLTPTLF